MKSTKTLLSVVMALAMMMCWSQRVWGATTPDYLCFKAVEAGVKIQFCCDDIDLSNLPSVQYSTTGTGNWKDYNIARPDEGTIITLTNVGDKVYFRAGKSSDASYTKNSTFSCYYFQEPVIFMADKKVSASGNVMSLLDASCQQTSMPEYAFRQLFQGCSNLTTAPKLPATTLANSCYTEMFDGCTGLTAAPELPAKNLARDCYYAMFCDCTGLTAAPELPATQLYDMCYARMFQGCSNLTVAPALPATTLTKACYLSMFNDCPSLTVAPDLPATKLESQSYQYMFSLCPNLKKVSVNLTDWSDTYPSQDWLAGVSKEGVFYCPKAIEGLSRSTSTIPEGWVVNDYLCFAAEESATNVSFNVHGTLSKTPTLQYSTDLTTWADYKFGDKVALANAGDKVYFRAKTTNNTFSESSEKYITFWADKKVAAGGNIMTLTDVTSKSVAAYAFYALFKDCKTLTEAPDLPAVTLSANSYESMFQNCTAMTMAPILPATTVAGGCYNNMFNGCTSLNRVTAYFTSWQAGSAEFTTDWLKNVASQGKFLYSEGLNLSEKGASRIPAGWTTADHTAIDYLCVMAEADNVEISFKQHGKLKNVPSIQYSTDKTNWSNYTLGKTITLQDYGDNVYFKATEKNSTFSEATSKTDSNYVYFSASQHVGITGNVMSLLDATCQQMSVPQYAFHHLFFGCANLIQAPELPATTLADSCYASMFAGCTSLEEAPELPAMQMARKCYDSMFEGCTQLHKAPQLPATTLAVGCYENMFHGCTQLTKMPTLPATKTEEACYYCMFMGCTGLSEPVSLPATTLTKNCYSSMFSGCSSLNKVSVSFTEWPFFVETTTDWLKDVASKGMFVHPEDLLVFRNALGIPERWTYTSVDMPSYLCFRAEDMTGGAEVCFSVTGTLDTTPALEYSTDMKTWKDYTFGEGITLYTSDDNICFRAKTTNATFSKDYDNYIHFTATGKVVASGNIMSLLDASCAQTTVPEYAFNHLFEDCSNLTDAPEMPATTLAQYCYAYMYKGCSALASKPELPATSLQENCYAYMFKECTKLESTLDYLCFTAQEDGLRLSFKESRSNGDRPSMQYSTDRVLWLDYTLGTDITLKLQEEDVYFKAKSTNLYFSDKFFGYYVTFSADKKVAASGNVMSLRDATCEERNVRYSDFCRLFYGCSNLTTAPTLPATVVGQSGYEEMFSGCTSLVTAPLLPATDLYSDSYSGMFKGCTNLKQVTVAFTSWDGIQGSQEYSKSFTTDWLDQVSADGAFLCSPALDFTKKGSSAIPEGWSVKLATQLNSEGYGTFSSAYNTQIVSGGNSYTVHFSGDNLIGTKITDNMIPAYNGVLLYGEPNAIVAMDTIASAPALSNNDLMPTTTGNGLAKKVDSYTLSGSTFMNFAGTSYNPCKAFLPHSAYKGGGNLRAKSFRLVWAEPSEITNVDADKEKVSCRDVKYMKNGRLVIKKDGKLFNVAGMIVR